MEARRKWENDGMTFQEFAKLASAGGVRVALIFQPCGQGDGFNFAWAVSAKTGKIWISDVLMADEAAMYQTLWNAISSDLTPNQNHPKLFPTERDGPES